MLATSLNLNSHVEAKTNNVIYDNLPDIELVNSPIDITWNVERRTWVKFPVEYREKLQEFVDNNVVMQDKDTSKFTEDFIVNQMKSDWWISKPNQLLFLRSIVYNQVTNKDLYDWSDEDDSRFEEFGNIMDYRENCWQEYKDWLLARLKQRYHEADRMSAEAKKEAVESLNRGIEAMIDFYNSYQISPDPKRFQSFQTKVKEAISLCKEYGIDYKSHLSPEIRKFYGIE